MKYQPPYGISDPNGPYINGNPAAGIEGSIPPAAAFEYPMREIVAMIQAGDFVPSDGDLTQLLKAIRRQYVNYAVDTGVVNALVVTLAPPLENYHAGFPLRILVAVTNTGASAVNVNGLGPRAIKRGDGSDLHAGDLTAGMIAGLVDTGTVFQLQNPLLGVASTSNNFFVKIPYVVDSSPTANAIIAPFVPPITTTTEGDFISVRVAHANTGPTTIAVNALAALPICRDDGQPLQAGDLLANEQILLENHSSYWQVPCMVRSQLLLPPAPKLRGFIADAYGYPVQTFGNAVAGAQAIQYYGVRSNSMQTSTFDGQTLTVGAGENGIWSIYGSLHTQYLSTEQGMSTLSVYVNGGGLSSNSDGLYPPATAIVMGVTGTVLLNVGDQVQIRYYQQGVPQVQSSPDPTTRMTAYLVSK
jgi:hypothetical protein